MKHGIYRVVSVSVAAPYTVRVGFDDGVERVIDLAPILRGELYGPLQDLTLFGQVTIDPEVHTLVWPNGADFDPETLHDWPKYEKAMAKRASEWESPERRERVVAEGKAKYGRTKR
jgi:hypothetical protein